ncbi:MAG: sulfotransferase domain-containing protein [Imperialibacter sp.]|uniref:sulfotransferase domain-containing protein n=1 Tax=Imperialibacter sp. TaxID=2038411 RepID=UPI0032F08149
MAKNIVIVYLDIGTGNVVRNRLGRIIVYAKGVLGLSKRDIVLVSFPKSGNTWVRFVINNYISLSELNGKIVTFSSLDQVMPEFGVNDLLKPWPYKSMPRFVKTHWAWNPLFAGKKSLLIVRDPRDTMVSYYNYRSKQVSAVNPESFQTFIRDKKFGLEAWFKHLKSWEKKATCVIRYEDLKRDGLKEISDSLQKLSLDINTEILSMAFDNAAFDKLKANEQIHGMSKMNFFSGGQMFFNKGKTNQWVEYFSERDLEYYQELKSKYRLNAY